MQQDRTGRLGQPGDDRAHPRTTCAAGGRGEGDAVPSVSIFAVLTSFGAGVVSFLSPCVLPLVPGYVSYVAGQSIESRSGDGAYFAALRLSTFFLLGFSTIFGILVASWTALVQ